MDFISILGSLLVGFILGIVIAFVLRIVHANTAKKLAEDLIRETDAQRQAHLENILSLAKSKLETEREINVKELDAKKGLIDQQLSRMGAELENVSKLMKDLEKDRVERFGELSSHLKTAGEQTAALAQTTSMLKEALASTKVRGQWGERMAEDVLRLAGFIENINYVKQKTIEGVGSRPDFTFLLPKELKLNMDVKFPLDNYLKYLEAGTEPEKAKCRNDFLKDVKLRVKEVTTREYIDPAQSTVDCVLLLIPNEQIYSFIHEQDSTILDDGIKNKVVICSPITLFAVLAVIRQAIDNFSLEQTSNEILSLLGAFKKQWDEYVKRFDVLGKRIEDAQKEYETLTTTRKRKLDSTLSKIEYLRTQKGLPIANDISPAIEAVEEDVQE